MSEIEAAQKRYSLLDNFPLGIYIIRNDFMVLFWNNEIENWTGISKGEIVGTNLIDHYPHLHEPKYLDRIRIIFEGGPPAVFSSLLHNYIIPSSLPDGGFRSQDATVVPVNALDKKGFDALFIIHDITDLTKRIQDYRIMRDQARDEIGKRKQAEEQLRKYSHELEGMVKERTSKLDAALKNLQGTQSQLLQSEKMVAIGQLAAGVAHEINNPTGFISSNLNTLAEYYKDTRALLVQYKELVSSLKKAVPTEEDRDSISDRLDRIETFEKRIDIDFILDDATKLVEECCEGTERIKKIVIDLKDFAHPGKQELTYADINHNLDSTLNIVWNELKYKATVTKDYGSLPHVKCYPQQINQVFMNLLVNAAQAIDRKGEITIRTRAINSLAEIKISDTGIGIPEESLPKIFDPFFTTKEVGKGTGLGLNVSYNIIKKHNGTIDVESTEGKGTTFIIRIPIDVDDTLS